MTLTDYALDHFVAPQLSDLSRINAPDLSGASPGPVGWIPDFVINSMLRVRVAHPYRQYIFAFLRRAEDAHYEYEAGRQAAIEYLQRGRDAVSVYMRAVHHFEAFLAQAYQAFWVLVRMGGGEKLFDKGDGTALERLGRLYNTSKHIDGNIKGHRIPEDCTVAIWLTNTGISCAAANLAYAEMAEMVSGLARQASLLANPGLPDSEAANP